jgi:hypothetical protein
MEFLFCLFVHLVALAHSRWADLVVLRRYRGLVRLVDLQPFGLHVCVHVWLPYLSKLTIPSRRDIGRVHSSLPCFDVVYLLLESYIGQGFFG